VKLLDAVAVDLDPLSLLSRLAASVPRPGSTPSATQACSPLPASSARASCPSRRHPPKTSTRRLTHPRSEAAAATARGRSCSSAPSASTCSSARSARGG
jgi:hypothetical protein